MVRLYDPRNDRWMEHFWWTEGCIDPLTDIGEVTVSPLVLNHSGRVAFRSLLVSAARYPLVD